MYTRSASLKQMKLLSLSVPVGRTCMSVSAPIYLGKRALHASIHPTSFNQAKCKKIRFSTQQLRYNSITSSTDGSIIPSDVVQLSIQEYHDVADETFEQLLTDLDSFFEDHKIMEADVDEEAGVMEINCSEGTYVINKQPPTKQIWLSSPISGPKRFDYHDNSWISLRDGVKLSELLESEMKLMYGDFKWSKPF